MQTRERTLTRHQSASTLIFKTVRNKCLLLKPPSLGYFVVVPKLTQMGSPQIWKLSIIILKELSDQLNRRGDEPWLGLRID